jgi:pimeloyl-ACP methyl ester carboxylesterase
MPGDSPIWKETQCTITLIVIGAYALTPENQKFISAAPGVAYGIAGHLFPLLNWTEVGGKSPPRSEMATVGRRKVHVACIGTGREAFVLDSGLGGWSVFWWRLPLLAQAGRACILDRQGDGWSDPARNSYDGLAAADELAALVAAGRIQTPFIYVGHSLGANFAQSYYAKYPKSIAALVLLEPGNPKDLLEDFHGSRAEAMAAFACDWKC